jgi:hypothetical protein
MNGMGSLGGGLGSLGGMGGMGMSPETRSAGGGAAKMAEMAKYKLNPGLFGSMGARQDDFQVGLYTS